MQAKIQVRVSAENANVINEDGTRIFRVKNGKNEFVDYDVTGNKTARFETLSVASSSTASACPKTTSS